MATKVLLVEDDAMMRAALRALLAKADGIEVVGEAADGLRAVELAAKLNPDVLVVDIGLPGLDGLEATRRILATRPQATAVVLSGFADRRTLEAARKAGAAVVVPKERAFEELVTTVKAVAASAR